MGAHRMGLCFSLAMAVFSGWQEPRQTQVVYQAYEAPETHGQTVSPFSRGHEPLERCPEEQGWVSVFW
jgi:hypothetical protein